VVETNEVVQKLEEEGLAGFIEELGGAIPEGGGASPEGGMSPDGGVSPDGGGALGGALGGILKPKDPNALGNQMGEIFGNDEIGEAIGDFSSTVTGGEIEGLGTISDVFAVLRAVTSVGMLVGGIAICLVLIAGIILVNIKQLNKGLRRSGLPLMFASLGFAADLVVLFVPSLFEGMEMQLVRQILLMTTGVNGVVFGLGLAMVIAGFVVGSIAKKNAARAVARSVPATVGAPVEILMDAPVAAPEEAPAEVSEDVPAEETAEESPEEPAEEVAEVCETAEEAQPQED